MGRIRGLRASSALALVALLGAGPSRLLAEDAGDAAAAALAAELAKMKQEHQRELQELEAMLAGRDQDDYELDLRVGDLKQVLVRQAGGREQPFHYVTFRVRNLVAKGGVEDLKRRANAYNEVLAAIAKDFANTRVVTEGGVRLEVTDVRNEDPRLATVLERQDLRVQPRSIRLNAWIDDEHGTRFRMFDPVPGQGPQEAFAFSDRSLTAQALDFSQQVREEIERVEQRRLYTARELRGLAIPPYDATKPSTFADGYGMAQGEVNGVLIFDQIAPTANRVSLRLVGLSNRLRLQWPKRANAELVDDYWNLSVIRRVHVTSFQRPGDELHRLSEPFAQVGSDWAWEPTFQRIDQRKALAYARYDLDRIALAEPRSRAGSVKIFDADGKSKDLAVELPVLHDAAILADHQQRAAAEQPAAEARRTERKADLARRDAGRKAMYAVPDGEQSPATAEEQVRRAAALKAWEELAAERLRQLEAGPGATRKIPEASAVPAPEASPAAPAPEAAPEAAPAVEAPAAEAPAVEAPAAAEAAAEPVAEPAAAEPAQP